MTVQQWRLRKVTEPRTLADVPDGSQHVCVAGVTSGRLMVMHRKGNKAFYSHSDGADGDDSLLPPYEFKLYHPPSRPTRLEDVPDRRVIAATWEEEKAKPDTRYLFRERGIWFDLKGVDNYTPRMASYWRLTDCIVELETVEVGVLG